MTTVQFSYSRFAMFPQIPYVRHVLFKMGLLTDQETIKEANNHLGFCEGNAETYIENLDLLLSMVREQNPPSSLAEFKQMVALKIIELCPPDAKCLFTTAYPEAMELAGYKVLRRWTTPRDELIESCNCPDCYETKEAQRRHHLRLRATPRR